MIAMQMTTNVIIMTGPKNIQGIGQASFHHITRSLGESGCVRLETAAHSCIDADQSTTAKARNGGTIAATMAIPSDPLKNLWMVRRGALKRRRAGSSVPPRRAAERETRPQRKKASFAHFSVG